LTNSDLKERLTDTITLLRIPGVGRGRYRRLTDAFGSPAKVLAARVSELEVIPQISRSIAAAIKESADLETARQLAARIIQLGWTVLFADQDDFPETLRHIPDPPPVLFCTGRPVTNDEKLIAIVGTRHATEKGRRFTYRLAADLAGAGVTVVSGMAEGVDSYAHQGALDAGGRTVAVWATSLDVVYPPINRELAARIEAGGAVYSEHVPGTKPEPGYFPDRNRIISGLSDGVVVVEAPMRSGALITAAHGLEQGKELFAVPGPPDVETSLGTNHLIKKGARLITSAQDIFDELPRLRGEVAARKFKQRPDMTSTEQRLVEHLATGPAQIDALARELDLPMVDLMPVLLALELKGVIEELSGKRFVLVE
jgi:DNA processing protein